MYNLSLITTTFSLLEATFCFAGLFSWYKSKKTAFLKELRHGYGILNPSFLVQRLGAWYCISEDHRKLPRAELDHWSVYLSTINAA